MNNYYYYFIFIKNQTNIKKQNKCKLLINKKTIYFKANSTIKIPKYTPNNKSRLTKTFKILIATNPNQTVYSFLKILISKFIKATYQAQLTTPNGESIIAIFSALIFKQEDYCCIKSQTKKNTLLIMSLFKASLMNNLNYKKKTNILYILKIKKESDLSCICLKLRILRKLKILFSFVLLQSFKVFYIYIFYIYIRIYKDPSKGFFTALGRSIMHVLNIPFSVTIGIIVNMQK